MGSILDHADSSEIIVYVIQNIVAHLIPLKISLKTTLEALDKINMDTINKIKKYLFKS